jgi:Protein of unknown function (DUF3349)
VPDHLLPPLGVLRRAYPEGIPRSDYAALLDFLRWHMSERSLVLIVATVIDGDPVAIATDSAALAGPPAELPVATAPEDIWRVRSRLESHGWDEVARDFDGKDLHARISPLPEVPDYVLDGLAVLRRAYPDGIPGAEYRALLAALCKDMSYRNVGALVGAFTGRNYVEVANEAQGATSLVPGDRAPPRDVDRVWVKLLGHGWIPEFPLPRYEEPGFTDEAVAALQRAYPDGLTDDGYPPLIAALARDIDDHTPIACIVSEAFPGRDPHTIWRDVQAVHDAGKASTASPAALPAAGRAWQHLLAHGFPRSGGARQRG